MPQYRSAFSRGLHLTRRPSAVTTSADSRLSPVKPHLRSSQPLPLPSARPAMPVVENPPPDTASPKACVSRSNSPHVRPASARTVRLSTSTRMPFIADRSITRPSSQLPWPFAEWPPQRTATSMAFARANSTAWITSATPAQRAIAAGRRSNIPFQTLRASSYPGLSAVSTSPRSASVSWATAACGTPTLVVMRALLVSGSASSLSPHAGEAQERRGDDSAAEEVLDHDQRSRLPADLAVLPDPRGG